MTTQKVVCEHCGTPAHVNPEKRATMDKRCSVCHEVVLPASRHRSGLRSLWNRIRRGINKNKPTRFANVTRDGMAMQNPRLVGENK